MGSVNRVFLMGHLTRKPEVRVTPSGAAVSDLGVAVNERYRNKEGQTVETVCFADVVVWGNQAKACGQYLDKGSPVMVEGRLHYDTWQTEKGEKRSRLRVRADRVQFLARRGANARGEVGDAPDGAGGELEEPAGVAASGADLPF